MPIKAIGQDYFDRDDCPIHAVRVSGDDGDGPSHPHDLTGIEHDHDFNELVIVTAGRATHHLGGQTYPVCAGDTYLLHSSDRHRFADRDRLELLNVMYDPGRLDLPVDELRSIPGFNVLFVLEPMYRRRHKFQSRLFLPPLALQATCRLAGEVLDEVTRRGPGFRAAARVKLIELMIHLARQYDGTRSTESGALLRLGSLMGALEDGFDQPWTLAEMAEMASMSPSNLVRVFRRATGQTPMDYLIQLRLRRATRLLETSDLSVTQIAHQVGFNDSNYFSRQFSKCLGVPPRRHRETHVGAM